MQTTTLNVTLGNGKLPFDTVLNLQCPLGALGCETTSLSFYDYIWDYPDNCAISIFRIEKVNMVEQRKKYVISADDSRTKFVFEVKNNPQKHCGKPTSIYSTNCGSFYLDRVSEGLDMDTGRNLGRDENGGTEILQDLGPKEKSNFGQLYAHNPQLEGTQESQTQDSSKYLNIDYGMHLGTKIDYSFFRSSQLLQATEVQLFVRPM